VVYIDVNGSGFHTPRQLPGRSLIDIRGGPLRFNYCFCADVMFIWRMLGSLPGVRSVCEVRKIRDTDVVFGFLMVGGPAELLFQFVTRV